MIGLTRSEVQERVNQGLVNVSSSNGTKTDKEIIKDNCLTFFNIIFLILALLLLIAGKFKDMTFLLIVIANTVISSYQEIKSKRAIDSLKILASKKVKVYRDNQLVEVDVEELVKDDVVELSIGVQIPADAVVLNGSCKVNESLLTGEEDDIDKNINDILHSGSVISSGTVQAKLTAVGDASYASKLQKEATTNVTQAKSEMMASLDKLIKVIGFILVPIGILLFFNEFWILKHGWQDSIQSMVAALIGMIPEGLYLLTSVALAASVLRLTQKKVLVRNLDCVETLARIDTLCVDKTGTITEPGMSVEEVVPLRNDIDVKTALCAFAHAFQEENDTLKAIKAFYNTPSTWIVNQIVPFSSSIKYSAASFSNGMNIVVGAPQFIYGTHFNEIQNILKPYMEKEFRVVLAGTYSQPLDGKAINSNALQPFAAIIISNHIRKDADKTFSFFKEQGVTVKVISGDDPLTVSRVAKQACIENAENYVDATTLKDEDIPNAVERYTVFGRTTPQQKQKMVIALKEKGHHVAMTGDGVNDVLALKEADCGIAMASGSEAASQIAKLVLLNSDFASVPSIVAEGRRVINNIERSAQLFLAKNIFSLCLSIFCVIFSLSYPFKPIQLSLISTLTIGIPGFFLAMQPNDRRIEGSFIKNVLYRAFPGGLCDLILIASITVYAYYFKLTDVETNTLAVFIALIVGIDILYYACKPLNKFRACVLGGITIASIFAWIFLADFFYLGKSISIQALLLLILFVLLAIPCMNAVRFCIFKINDAYHWVLDKYASIKNKKKQPK